VCFIISRNLLFEYYKKIMCVFNIINYKKYNQINYKMYKMSYEL
jgi:hypothetical protein